MTTAFSLAPASATRKSGRCGGILTPRPFPAEQPQCLKLKNFGPTRLTDSRIRATPDDDEAEKGVQTTSNGDGLADSFDGKGFAGYLAPYVLAFFLAVGVTAAFVKFVLLDY